jgi:hypothetical protein
MLAANFMERFHPFINRDYKRLRRIVDAISFGIGGKLDRNPTFDERGLTDELLDSISVNFNRTRLTGQFINLNIHKPSEKRTGADILIRVKNNRREIKFDRYVLLQAKKFVQKTGKFHETDIGNAHLTSQVSRMHSYNPEFSYLLLYSPTEEPSGNKVSQFDYSYILRYWDIDPDFEDFVGSSSILTSEIRGSYPVTTLRTKNWEKLTDNLPENLLNYSETFSNFLLDDLVTGKIGKDWDTVIEKAQGEFSIIATLTYGVG